VLQNTHEIFFSLYQHIYRYNREARVIQSTRRTQGSIPVKLPIVVDDPEANNPADVLVDLPEGLHIRIVLVGCGFEHDLDHLLGQDANRQKNYSALYLMKCIDCH